jgi:hypothetical protein
MKHVLPVTNLLLVGGTLIAAAACTPTVRLEAPQEPIVINLNVKIEQEVRVRIDRELENTIQNNPDLF